MTLEDKIQQKFNERIKNSPELLFMVNAQEKKLLSQELVDYAAKETKYAYFEKIYSEFRTKNICQEAFLANPKNIKHMSLLEIKEHLPQQILYKALLHADRETTELIKPYFFIDEFSKEEQIELLKKNTAMASEIKDIERLKECMDVISADLEYFPSYPDPNDRDHYPEIIYSPREKFQRNLISHVNKKFEKELYAYSKGGKEAVEKYLAEKEETILTDRGELSIDEYITHIVNGSTVKILEGFDINNLNVLGISPHKYISLSFDEEPTHMLHLEYKSKQYTTYLKQKDEGFDILITMPHEREKDFMINTTLEKLSLDAYRIAQELQGVEKRQEVSNIVVKYGVKHAGGLGRNNYVRDVNNIEEIIFDYKGKRNKVKTDGKVSIEPISSTSQPNFKSETVDTAENTSKISNILFLKKLDEAIAEVDNLTKEETKER